MSETTLLDTDIFSEVLRNKNATVRARAEAYLAQHQQFTISVITVVEVAKGFHKAGRADALKRFVDSLPSLEILPLGSEEAVAAGLIYGDLERLGQPIGRADPLIAGIAVTRGLVLATGNEDHYARIQNAGHALRIDNWRASR